MNSLSQQSNGENISSLLNLEAKIMKLKKSANFLTKSPQIADYLNKLYEKNTYPSKAEFTKIAKKFSVTTENIINWFKQRRRKDFFGGKLKSSKRYSREWFSLEQTQILKSKFIENPKPSCIEYKEMQQYLYLLKLYQSSNKIQATVGRIKNWFAHQRQKKQIKEKLIQSKQQQNQTKSTTSGKEGINSVKSSDNQQNSFVKSNKQGDQSKESLLKIEENNELPPQFQSNIINNNNSMNQQMNYIQNYNNYYQQIMNCQLNQQMPNYNNYSSNNCFQSFPQQIQLQNPNFNYYQQQQSNVVNQQYQFLQNYQNSFQDNMSKLMKLSSIIEQNSKVIQQTNNQIFSFQKLSKEK